MQKTQASFDLLTDNNGGWAPDLVSWIAGPLPEDRSLTAEDFDALRSAVLERGLELQSEYDTAEAGSLIKGASIFVPEEFSDVPFLYLSGGIAGALGAAGDLAAIGQQIGNLKGYLTYSLAGDATGASSYLADMQRFATEMADSAINAPESMQKLALMASQGVPEAIQETVALATNIAISSLGGTLAAPAVRGFGSIGRTVSNIAKRYDVEFVEVNNAKSFGQAGAVGRFRIVRKDVLNPEFFKSEVSWTAPNKGTGIAYKVYRQDIDWDLKVDGLTNLERAAAGKAPYVVKDGENVRLNLHHSRQNGFGPLYELTEPTHLYTKSGYGREALHPYGKYQHPDFPVNRKLFNVDKKQYWIDRYNEVVNGSL